MFKIFEYLKAIWRDFIGDDTYNTRWQSAMEWLSMKSGSNMVM